MKRGELSMSIIISAAIALLILVLLSVLILRAGGDIAEGTGCFGIEGAFCVPVSDRCSDYSTDDETFIQGRQSCTVAEEKCCVPFG